MRTVVSLFLLFAVFSPSAFAARPLSTDDAGTVDKNHAEMECGFEYADTDDGEYAWQAALKYGLSERWDVGVEVPYQYIDKASGSDTDGIGDIALSSKYNFLQDPEGIPVLALGFNIKTKTGNEDRGLGTGAVDYGISAILTKELDKVNTHLNLGYTYTGAPEGENHDDVFSYAWALEIPLNDSFNLVGELTGETNFEGDFGDNPFSALAGFNYALTEKSAFDLGAGWKISDASPDYLITTGLTFLF